MVLNEIKRAICNKGFGITASSFKHLNLNAGQLC